MTSKLYATLLWMATPAMVAAEGLPCLIDPSQVVELGSPVIGVLEKVHVERGDAVKRDQVVAELTAEVERKSVALAENRATDIAELQAAQTAFELAKREKQRALQMFDKQLVSKQMADQAVTEASLAERKLDQARGNLKHAQLELNLARAQLEQRILRSPINGVVIERFVSAGQRIQDQPVVKIAAVDPLKVEVIVPAQHFNALKPDQPAMITPTLPGFSAKPARIKIIDRIIDPASNTFRVTLELPNPDRTIPAGARCEANLGLK